MLALASVNHSISLHQDVHVGDLGVREDDTRGLITTSVCRQHSFVSSSTVNVSTNFLLATESKHWCGYKVINPIINYDILKNTNGLC